METKMTHISTAYLGAPAYRIIERARLATAAVLLAGAAVQAFADPAAAEGKFLYIQSNDHRDGQNSVIVYERGEDGSLSLHPAGPVLTGGTGIDNDTNGKLGPNDNDTPIAASADGKRLFAVNGHSNTIAVFDIGADGGLTPVAGSPFNAHGIGPVSVSISGDMLTVANRNEDPHQLDELRGAANSSYTSFRVGDNGGLTFLSKVENEDGHKATQILFASAQPGLAFGNDFQVDADFDGDGTVSRLFSEEAHVRGRLQSFRLADDGKLLSTGRTSLPETVEPAPDVPTLPLGIWDHPTKHLVYVGLVTRNQLGVFRYDDAGTLSFVTSVPNSGQDICWLRVNRSGTRLYAINNLPREGTSDTTSTLTVFDISGDRAEKPVEIARTAIPMPLGTFVNNRNAEQPSSTAFQLTLDDEEKYLYVINQRIDQTDTNTSKEGNVLHSFRILDDGTVEPVAFRHLIPDGVHHRARPQGVVTVDIQ
jgi:6-phosphogluconolactonase (cycloisomerase 2 family)